MTPYSRLVVATLVAVTLTACAQTMPAGDPAADALSANAAPAAPAAPAADLSQAIASEKASASEDSGSTPSCSISCWWANCKRAAASPAPVFRWCSKPHARPATSGSISARPTSRCRPARASLHCARRRPGEKRTPIHATRTATCCRSSSCCSGLPTPWSPSRRPCGLRRPRSARRCCLRCRAPMHVRRTSSLPRAWSSRRSRPGSRIPRSAPTAGSRSAACDLPQAIRAARSKPRSAPRRSTRSPKAPHCSRSS